MAKNLAKKPASKQTKDSRVETTPETGRRERNKQEKRDRIIAAAKELFATKGFADTTTQEIAEKADIGTGTLFLYAKSKEELLVMVFSGDMLEEAQNAFRHLPPSAALLDKLMLVFNSMIEYHDQDRELTRPLLKEVSVRADGTPSEDLARLMRGIYKGIGDVIIAGQAAGDIRQSVDPLMAAEALFGIYYLSLLNWISGVGSKARLLKRLRIKLAIGVEGLIDQAKASRPSPAKKTSRKA
ncbi:MAG: TetR/AcrR family transcriptional regulator [Parvibaculum sp.]|nr:TetR/AcrR family transcriptional regulator [Parvibaculum sp.]